MFILIEVTFIYVLVQIIILVSISLYGQCSYPKLMPDWETKWMHMQQGDEREHNSLHWPNV